MQNSMDVPAYFSIQHAIPGRLRVRFPALIGNKSRIYQIKSTLSGNHGILRVRTNHLCGSVTVHYDSELIEKQTIIAMMEMLPSNEVPPVNSPIKRAQKGNALVQEQTGIRHKNKPFRKLWNLAGTISVGVGIVGVFVPLVPTVPLFLLAGFCFWRGSPRLYNRLVNSGTFGRMVDDFRKGKGMTARSKLRAIGFMWVSLTISAVFLVSSLTMRIILLLVGIGVTLYILRIKTAVGQIQKGNRRLTAPK
jgi:uncharacterized membrane protein YbaN (DUF454 family)